MIRAAIITYLGVVLVVAVVLIVLLGRSWRRDLDRDFAALDEAEWDAFIAACEAGQDGDE